MGVLARWLGRRDAAEAWRPLYDATVAAARAPEWYRVGRVPDTIDGRFDMLATMLALVLIRLEDEGEAGREPAARLAELFIADMDGHLRQDGVGDIVVGKRVGGMMAALGGRISAYRAVLDAGGDPAVACDAAIRRLPDADAAARTWLARGVTDWAAAAARTPFDRLAAGALPEVRA